MKRFWTLTNVIAAFVLMAVIFGILFLSYQKTVIQKVELDSAYQTNINRMEILLELNELVYVQSAFIFSRVLTDKIDLKTASKGLSKIQKQLNFRWQAYSKDMQKTSSTRKDKLFSHVINNFSALVVAAKSLDLHGFKQTYENLHLGKKYLDIEIQKQKKDLQEVRDSTNLYYVEVVLFMFFAILTIAIFTVVLISGLIFYINKKNKLFKNFSQELVATNLNLQDLLQSDYTTGLYNRKAFNKLFNINLRSTLRDSKNMCIVFADLDYFKLYMQTYTKAYADKALYKISRSIEGLFRRAQDQIFYLDDGLFALLVYDISPQAAMDMSQKLIKAVEDLKIEHKLSEISPFLTISIGLLLIDPKRDLELSECENRAYQALNDAREQGRNKVCVARI